MKIVNGKPYIQQIKELIIEYAKWLGRDLSFQDIYDELKDPAKKYTAPEGELLVAVEGEDVLGMIAYHRHSDTRCEMKRLYVKPSCRGMKLGEKLIEELMVHARQAGYKEMVLDTIVPLQSAIHLYKKLGFAECEPYYHNPMPDVLYFRKEL
ncbi:GNAT family N-acetyltransferase [Huintestinicola butyrica]|uniref:GNAT family N-acetyltransferase n=1 Tax=Huintestinicola butyrica TaxID=2981728 RepID=UPI003F8097B6